MTIHDQPAMADAIPIGTNNSSNVLPSAAASERDIERSTLHEGSIQTHYEDTTKEKMEEPASLQAAGPTPCSVGQVSMDDFVEGGFEGWKVILGCALVAAPTVGKFVSDYLPFLL
jgi:hypothetical protein